MEHMPKPGIKYSMKPRGSDGMTARKLREKSSEAVRKEREGVAEGG